nr:MAG TPA: hypothetical protein [Caudoviricetes sp.]
MLFRCYPPYVPSAKTPEPLCFQWFRRFYLSYKNDED